MLSNTKRHIAPTTAKGPIRKNPEMGSINGITRAPKKVSTLSAVHPIVYLNERRCFLDKYKTNENAQSASPIISII
jgi:hypothetical protein